MSRYSPPAFACRLFQTVLPVPYRGALLGDLIEEYALRAESTSPSAATRWFWGRPVVPSRSSWDRHCEMKIGLSA